MKLQAQYNKVTIISSIVVILIAAIGYYFLLRYVLIAQLDEALKVEEVEIQDFITKHNALPDATVYKDQRIDFQKSAMPVKRHFSSLEAYNPEENETELSRRLSFNVNVKGQDYQVHVTKSEEATEELVWIILFTSIALIALLTAILFFSNRLMLKKLWQPFHSTLSSVKSFNLSAPEEIKLHSTSISEFNEMNESIRLMSRKVMNDYRSLRNFTDHASHEIQTPLAVINSKLGLLIQQPDLTKKSMEQIQDIYNAVEKLSRLSQSLLLLTKIENNQFHEKHEVRLDNIIKEKNREWREWYESKSIKVRSELEEINKPINKDLAEILISNLFKNAVRHSEAGSDILIHLDNNNLKFCNSGSSALNEEAMFDRFYKSEDSDGSGLGLSIVKLICDQYNYKVGYTFTNNQHCITVSLNGKN